MCLTGLDNADEVDFSLFSFDGQNEHEQLFVASHVVMMFKRRGVEVIKSTIHYVHAAFLSCT